MWQVSCYCTKLIPMFAEKNPCSSELFKVSQATISIFRRFLRERNILDSQDTKIQKNLEDLVPGGWQRKRRRFRWNSIKLRTERIVLLHQCRPSFSRRPSTSKTDQKGSGQKNLKTKSRLQQKESTLPRSAEGNCHGMKWTQETLETLAQERSSKWTQLRGLCEF